MMQHRAMNGVAIATCARSSFDEREAEARLEMLEMASRIIHGDSPWFALRVMTGREFVVQDALEVLGITSLVPQRKGPDLRRRHRVIPGVLQPVIYGYVLVQSDPSPSVLVAFKAVDNVIGVLGGAEKPMRLSASEVQRFQAMAKAGAYDWEQECGIVVKAGDKVRVKLFAYSGFDAEVITPNSNGKGDVVVSVNIFGRETPVTMPIAMLEKL